MKIWDVDSAKVSDKKYYRLSCIDALMASFLFLDCVDIIPPSSLWLNSYTIAHDFQSGNISYSREGIYWWGTLYCDSNIVENDYFIILIFCSKLGLLQKCNSYILFWFFNQSLWNTSWNVNICNRLKNTYNTETFWLGNDVLEKSWKGPNFRAKHMQCTSEHIFIFFDCVMYWSGHKNLKMLQN